MTTKTPAELPHSSQTDELSATDIFPLLADDRRRSILHYLSQHVGTVSLGELAEQLAVQEGKSTYDHYERILTNLHHSQLPKLVDGGLVRYDVETETVQRLDAIESVRPYLDLALEDDPSERDDIELNTVALPDGSFVRSPDTVRSAGRRD